MSENNKNPVAPYMAIGLSTVLYGIAERKYIKSIWKPSKKITHSAAAKSTLSIFTTYSSYSFYNIRHYQHTLSCLAAPYRQFVVDVEQVFVCYCHK